MSKRTHSVFLACMMLAAPILPVGALAKDKAPKGPVNVDCDSGESINDALDLGLPGEPLEIIVVGTCNENVTITLSQVTLRGVDPATSIINGQPEPDFDELDPIDQSPLVINDAGAVLIDNLTIQNGESSNVTVTNSQVVITNCVVQGAELSGIVVGSGSRAQIDNCTIIDNDRDGVLAFENGGEFITNSTMSGNRHGVNVYGSSFAQIGQFIGGDSGPTVITGNARDGVRAGGSSEIDVFNSQISANGEYGVRISGSSGSFLQNNTIDGNTTAGPSRAGVGVFQSSTASLVDNQIINHTNGHGILTTNTSTVTMTANTVDGNGAGIEFGSGVVAARSSAVQMRGDNTITNNDWSGVNLGTNSFFRAVGGGGETITNVGVSVFNGSPRLSLEAFNAGYIDVRDGAVITGNVSIGVLSTFRMRNNTLNGNVNVFGNSGLGIRNTVTVSGTVTCSPDTFEFSTGGVSRC